MSIGISLFARNEYTLNELSLGLTDRGYNLFTYFRGKHNIHSTQSYERDVLLFEVGENDIDCLLMIKDILKVYKKPVLVIGEVINDLYSDELYKLGVQDVISMPWYLKVIDLRIRAALKRVDYEENENKIIRWKMNEDILVLQQERHMAFLNDKEIKLTFSQWNILLILVGQGGVALSRNYLLRECLHFEKGDTRTLDNHIKNIRKVLNNSSTIETIHGYGYKLNGKLIKED